MLPLTTSPSLDVMDLHDAITAYLASRRVDGFAANTVKNDGKTLARLAAVCPAGHTTHGLSAVDIDRLFAARSEAGCGPGTLNTDLGSLKAFVKWLQARGLAPVLDPLAGRRWSKVINPVRLFLPVEDFDRVLDHADHPVDRMILATGLFLFTRASETQALRVGDVDMTDMTMSVTIVKTTDRDDMPVSAEYGRELRRFFRWYTQEVGPLRPDMYLHPRKIPLNNKNSPGEYVINPDLPVSRIADVINRVVSAAGYPAATGAREGGHTLRRSGALALYHELSEGRGHDNAIRIVSTMLHHADISMTERYLDLRLDRVTRNKILRGQQMFTGTNSPALTVVR